MTDAPPTPDAVLLRKCAEAICLRLSEPPRTGPSESIPSTQALVEGVLHQHIAPALARAASDREAVAGLEALVAENVCVVIEQFMSTDQIEIRAGATTVEGPTLLEALAAAGRRAR